jgi:hypothetical protein
MADMGERVARLEVRSDNYDRRIGDVEDDVKSVKEKVNAISVRWTVLMTAGATIGAAILNILVAVIAKNMGVS